MIRNYYGGGYMGNSLVDATQHKGAAGYNILKRGATWPFYRLTLSEDSVTLRTPWKVISKNISQINSVSLEMPATIKFQFDDKNDNFGFIHLNPTKILNTLKAQGIAVSNSEGIRIYIARYSVMLIVLLTVCVISIVVAGAMGFFK